MTRVALAISTRPVEFRDLAPVAEIDEKVGGRPRPRYWQTRLEIAALRPPWMSLVAEADGRIVGFFFGWVGESEFGIAARTAWIDLIAVAPAYRGRGVGQALMEQFIRSARELRAVEKIATLIDLGQDDVREFFTREGFRHGPLIQLEKPA